ncbi:major capsid family protein [Candidatus Arsenophonus triatominarum]|uniref:major capsid family protein n=1 Tax=Candidatus Arsenophonus triatominarum TaxID=57911 RepID=UPI0007C4B009|nr:major capsid family protein [Candidatus Arsenophonus triatominarum]
MAQLSHNDFPALMKRAKEGGVTLPPSVNRLYLANDAQPSTIANGGIPAIVAGGIDPNVIRTVFAPTRATEIYGERTIGLWEQDYWMIPRTEYSGHISSYGDYNDNGANQVNVEWNNVRQYRFQTMITYGDLEAARMGLAMINYAAEKQMAAANTINQDYNRFAFFGVEGVNYGALNNPQLPTPITPTKVSGKTKWEDKSIQQRYNDILALYSDLVGRTNGVTGDGVDMASSLTLVLSNKASVYLKSSNEIMATSLEDLIKKAFPNLRIETAPQLSTDAGELIQMFVRSYQGQPVCYVANSQKYRAFPLLQQHSSWSQKVAASTYGTVITQPMLFAQMLGI